MTDAPRPWTVLPYQPLERLEENLWAVEGDLPKMALKRRMTLIRLSDGQVIVHSALALTDADMAAVEAWGALNWMIVPNGYHRLDAPAFKARYPQLKVLCPEPFTAKVREQVPVDGALDALPWDPALKVESLDGLNGEAVLIVRSGPNWERTSLIFNDALFNQPHLPGAMGLVMRLLGSTGGPKMSLIGKLLSLKDKAAFRAHLLRLAELPGLTRIIVSHGQHITESPAAVLRQIAASL